MYKLEAAVKHDSDGSSSPFAKKQLNQTSKIDANVPFSQMVNDIKLKRGLSKLEDDNYVDIHGRHSSIMLS